MASPIIIIGDTHFPFHNAETLLWIYALIKKLSPRYVIQIGDLYDLYNFTRFPKMTDIMTPRNEIELGRKEAEKMWLRVQKIVPKATCYQLKGNHDSRAKARIIEKAPEALALMKLDELWEFSGVTTLESAEDDLVINGNIYQHGWRTKLGDHAWHNGCNTVRGHSHKGGLVTKRLGEKVIWELDVGYCADPTVAPLRYHKQIRNSKGTQGCGIVDSLGPRFCPYPSS